MNAGNRRCEVIAMFLLIFCLIWFSATFGQDAGPVRVGVGPIQTRLSLDRAVEIALANNFEIEIERSNNAIAAEALRGARGSYDPRLRWIATQSSQKTPTGSVLQAVGGRSDERSHSQNFYLEQKLPWAGASLEMGFENSRQSSVNPFLSLNPFTTSRLAFTLTQPLLRGRTIDRDRARLLIRRKQLDLSETQLELRIIETVAQIEQAYWDLAAARQDALVKADAVELAREQLLRAQRLVESGSLASVEVVAAEAEMQRRLDAWHRGIAAITEAENTLKALISNSREAPLWGEEIIPLDQRPLEPPRIEDLGAAVAKALQLRPELRAHSSRQEAIQIERRQNTDLVKPQINLLAGYSLTGLAGSPRTDPDPFTVASTSLLERVNLLSVQQGLPPLPALRLGGLPDTLVGGYGTALSNLFSGRYQAFQVGIAVELTVLNRQAEAELAQSMIVERRLKLEQAQLEQAIEVEVRNALQAIQTTRQRIAAAEASARAAREKLESETRLFEAGESTNFLVLTRQNEYADSRHLTLVANLDSNKALVRRAKAVGTTLSDHNIALK